MAEQPTEQPTIASGKNVLLIIDPQNDFTDLPYEENGVVCAGSLAVDGAISDYKKLVKLLKSVDDNFFSEIHVSLDTHTKEHIGHPGFWKKTNDGSNVTEIFKQIKCDNDEIYIEVGDNNEKIYIEPQKDDLKAYAIQYIKSFYNKDIPNPHGQVPMIWAEHCIEGTVGHKVNPTLKCELDNKKNKDKVTYHIKGQNNLAEMYSIFSAEYPAESFDGYNYLLQNSLVYTGDHAENEKDEEHATTYEEVTTKRNLKTERNDELLEQLLGTKDNQNTVYICGEARTHCVKSSAIDMLEYAAEKQLDQSKIIFISDVSSPIPNSKNDIVMRMTGSRNNDDENQNAIDLDNKRINYDEQTKNYGAKAMTTQDIINIIHKQSGGKSKKSLRKQKHNKQSKKGGKKANKYNKKSKKGGKKANKSVHKK